MTLESAPQAPDDTLSPESITIVSGLPRSGTSMMMKMLEAGGIEPFTDGVRAADDDNPEGYYEYEAVKRLGKEGAGWLDQVQGRAVKVISQLLYELPASHSYRVVFMHRALGEVLASQRQMLIRRGETTDDGGGDAQLRAAFENHVRDVLVWLRDQGNFEVLELGFRDVHDDPEQSARAVKAFLGGKLIDECAMAGVVNPELYRQRRGGE